jgi:hypothetical protein
MKGKGDFWVEGNVGSGDQRLAGQGGNKARWQLFAHDVDDWFEGGV